MALHFQCPVAKHQPTSLPQVFVTQCKFCQAIYGNKWCSYENMCFRFKDWQWIHIMFRWVLFLTLMECMTSTGLFTPERPLKWIWTLAGNSPQPLRIRWYGGCTTSITLFGAYVWWMKNRTFETTSDTSGNNLQPKIIIGNTLVCLMTSSITIYVLEKLLRYENLPLT